MEMQYVCMLSSILHPTESREILMTDLMAVKYFRVFFLIKKERLRNGNLIKF